MNKQLSCIGVIMDGNRRWAKERNLPTLEGHRKGSKKLSELMSWARAKGVPHIIVYAFSTENWNRSKEEVSYLMKLFRNAFKEWQKKSEKEKVRIIFAGDRTRFSDDMQKEMKALESASREFRDVTLTICLSYGGRAEIVNAVKTINDKGLDVTEESIEEYLWTGGAPAPDIIIRTGGERRLSNFLTWQSVYTELFFVDTYWPAFSQKEFTSIITEYATRQRRFGI